MGRRLGTALLTGGLLQAPAADYENCACSGLTIRQEPARGAAVVLLSRVDAGGGAEPAYRVEAAAGKGRPATGQVVRGMGCDAQAYVHQLFGMVRRPDGMWLSLSCVGEDLSAPITVLLGEPAASPAAGPAVALATGEFGAAHMVTLDADGNAVAWNRRGAEPPTHVALCPGGRTVVTLDHDELAVYDLDGFRLRRAVPLERTLGGVAMRCADPAGEVVQLLSRWFLDLEPSAEATVVTVRGTTVRKVPVRGPVASTAVPTAEGFLVYGPSDPALIRSDGQVRRFPDLDVPGGLARLRVAPDGRTAAATTLGTYDRETAARVPSEVIVVDLMTSQVTARWRPPAHPDGLEWTASGNLMVRLGYADGRSGRQDPGRVVELDRLLRVLGERPGAPGSGFAVVGERAVFFGGTRLSVAGDRAARPVEEPWLAAVSSLVPLPGAGDVRAARALGGPVSSTDPPARAAALLALLVALGGLALRLRRAR